MEIQNTIGRRKSSVARIYLKEGIGDILINKRKFDDYFTTQSLRYTVLQPLKILNLEGQYDINVNLNGGGLRGQAEALRLAIARSLVKLNEEENKAPLKKHKLLTRDSRVVERKKPGRPKARKRFQFSKR